MKNVLCFVFLLTFPSVLSRQDVQKRGGLLSRLKAKGVSTEVTPQSTTRALDKLVENGAPFIDSDESLVSSYCKMDMVEKMDLRNPQNGVLCNFGQTTCYAVGLSNLAVRVISKIQEPAEDVPSGSEQCAMRPAFQAVFLPFAENGDTYMILNPDVAPWFFTTELGGCDIFVARPKPGAPIPANSAIVVHSNLNKCKNNVLNLQSKGESVDQLLQLHLNFNLIARWYYEPLPGEMASANQYLEKYRREHPGITLMSYSADPPNTAQLHHFIGHYDGGWKFILKGIIDGKTTPVFTW